MCHTRSLVFRYEWIAHGRKFFTSRGSCGQTGARWLVVITEEQEQQRVGITFSGSCYPGVVDVVRCWHHIYWPEPNKLAKWAQYVRIILANVQRTLPAIRTTPESVDMVYIPCWIRWWKMTATRLSSVIEITSHTVIRQKRSYGLAL